MMIRHAAVILLMASPAFAGDAGTATWTPIYEVFSHPRCANCHVGPDNVPMWSGSSYGAKPRPHGMNIDAGVNRIGAEYIHLQLLSCPPELAVAARPAWRS
jgi:hypothetical protein